MRIGIVGSGKIGTTLARLLLPAGHEVWIANRRGPASLQDLVPGLGPRAHASTVAQAAEAADVVIVAVPFGAYQDLPAGLLDGKVVIDATNYVVERDGPIAVIETGQKTSTEVLAAHLPGARVVKTYNSIFWEHLRDDGRPSGSPNRHALPLAGDDPDAKQAATQLLTDTGFDAVDAGELSQGQRFQRGTPPYVQRYTADELTDALNWTS
ncbi:MAG: NADPH-dependent F420 reductase [Actinobacteria bacterium]|nr:NADPH-dependent F420 reductase [Actinomycetota bacterium]